MVLLALYTGLISFSFRGLTVIQIRSCKLRLLKMNSLDRDCSLAQSAARVGIWQLQAYKWIVGINAFNTTIHISKISLRMSFRNVLSGVFSWEFVQRLLLIG